VIEQPSDTIEESPKVITSSPRPTSENTNPATACPLSGTRGCGG
jgi:hypothetical protein